MKLGGHAVYSLQTVIGSGAETYLGPGLNCIRVLDEIGYVHESHLG